jgi:uncharacterized protein (TIGR02118 family)
MIKLVTFQKRVPALSRPGFEQRWLTIHGPMAAQFPGLRAYMLSYSIEPGEPPADGVAQLWFDSRRACQDSYATQIGRDGSRDASAFLARREHLLASEVWRTVPAPPTWRHKLLICVKRRPEQARAEFVSWWLAGGADAAAAATGSAHTRLCVDEAGQLLNSATSGTLDLVAGEGVYDGMLEQWFASAPEMQDAAARLEAGAAWMALQGSTSRIERGLLHEHVVVPLAQMQAA